MSANGPNTCLAPELAESPLPRVKRAPTHYSPDDDFFAAFRRISERNLVRVRSASHLVLDHEGRTGLGFRMTPEVLVALCGRLYRPAKKFIRNLVGLDTRPLSTASSEESLRLAITVFNRLIKLHGQSLVGVSLLVHPEENVAERFFTAGGEVPPITLLDTALDAAHKFGFVFHHAVICGTQYSFTLEAEDIYLPTRSMRCRAALTYGDSFHFATSIGVARSLAVGGCGCLLDRRSLISTERMGIEGALARVIDATQKPPREWQHAATMAIDRCLVDVLWTGERPLTAAHVGSLANYISNITGLELVWCRRLLYRFFLDDPLITPVSATAEMERDAESRLLHMRQGQRWNWLTLIRSIALAANLSDFSSVGRLWVCSAAYKLLMARAALKKKQG